MKPYGVLSLMMPFLACVRVAACGCVCALCDDGIMALENDHLALWELVKYQSGKAQSSNSELSYR